MSAPATTLARNLSSTALLLLIAATGAYSQPSLYEVEPNNTPAEATEISGEVLVIGAMEGGDQDAYRWTVSDVDAQKRWTLELQGIPGRLTLVEVIQVEYADNGIDVVGTDRLFKMGTRDGSKPSIHEDLLFEPGEYILGVAHGGGGGGSAYRPPVDSVSFGDQGVTKSADTSEPGGYRLTIREGSSLHLEQKPQDRATVESAYKLRLGSENAAYLETPDTWYRFDISDKDASQSWDLNGQVPVGRQVNSFLYASDGTQLAKTSSDGKGRLSFRDLGLEVGSYTVELASQDSGYIRTLIATSVGQRIEGAEAEPNDSWKLANRASLSQPVTGRMAKGNEADYFLFSLDDATADHVLELKLETGGEQQIQLCLLDSRGQRLQCRSAKGTVGLPDLVLTPGEWGFVAERGPEGAEYTVTLSQQGSIEAGREAEPNDRVEFASGVPSNNRIKGRFSGTDTDFYKVLVTDEPQLWRFQVIGDEIHELAYNDGAGIQNQVYRAPAGQRRVRLDNVFLMPGIHHVRVSGRDGGTYTLLARAIGPPDPNGEFEPNDDTSRMQPLRFGQTRTGLLEDGQDSDNYRFYLGAWDRIRLTIAPPPDGEIMAHLYWDKSSFKQFNRPQPGQKVILEGLFPPGDYRLALSAKTTSEAEYRLSLERLERFGCPTDCEPNDNLDFANPLPAEHIVEGRVHEWRDSDWYRLPLFDEPAEIILSSEPRHEVQVVTRAYAARSVVAWDHEAELWRGTVPAGSQHYLQVKGSPNSPYRLEVRFPKGPAVRTEPAELSLELSLELEAAEVGAYRHYGQQVEGRLLLTNKGSASASVSLQAVTSDFRWQVELMETEKTIPAGGKQVVPLTLLVPADAWADWPVRLSVQATTNEGARRETFFEISAGRETPPVNAVYGWTVPDELRGGFNVAWEALGGRWTGEKDTVIGTGFPYLFDGMMVENLGLQMRGGTELHEDDVVVELAGEEPIEVAGLMLSELAGTDALRFLHNLDFAVSLDGKQFIPVVEDELMPIKAEQAFVLDRPTLARYARLQLRRAFDGTAGPSLGFGELKVIAKPGIDISGGKGFNVAAPALGGHVVWSRPAISASNWDGDMLREDEKYNQRRVKAGQALDWVVGFHHDRAAQITRLEWADSPKLPPGTRIESVSVAISLNSPVGPWQPLGEWNLSSGSMPTFTLDQPTWARFVKFSVAGPEAQKTHSLPAVLRIWERPTAEEYRSILAEWGFANQAAIYEELHPLRTDKPFKAAGHESKAKAAPLEFGRLVDGQVVLGQHEHWYRLNVPEDQNSITISIGGDPSVRTAVHLENNGGEPVLLRRLTQESTPHLHTFEAIVEPGGSYYLKVEEPPRNVVFLWDTSASVGAYLPVIYNSLLAYAEDVVPGRDAANLIPFGGKLLLRDWYGEPYILQTVLNDYPRKESSSEAEGTLYTATRALAPRAGTKAIVMVTDAATNRYPLVWDEFERVQPRVFGLGVGSQGALGRHPAREQDLMQDWSRVNGGHYTYLLSEGEMEIAFDRAATMLRRPAGYTLEVVSTFKETPGPGSLQVIATDSGSAAGAVELILDASGSMLKRLEGKRRIVIAKEVLTEAVTEHIPAGTPVALRVFGHKEPNSCRTDLELSLRPLLPAAASQVIQRVEAKNLAKTPIADSLAKVESDLKAAKGRKVIVLVTDGEETCEGDPEKVIQKLQDKGFDISLNIVGFAIDDVDLASQFESWARLGGGRYFSASSEEGLSEALKGALQTPFAVYDTGGTLVGEGVVGGDSIELDQGFYRVVVQTSPPQTFSKVEVPGEREVQIELAAGGS